MLVILALVAAAVFWQVVVSYERPLPEIDLAVLTAGNIYPSDSAYVVACAKDGDSTVYHQISRFRKAAVDSSINYWDLDTTYSVLSWWRDSDQLLCKEHVYHNVGKARRTLKVNLATMDVNGNVAQNLYEAENFEEISAYLLPESQFMLLCRQPYAPIRKRIPRYTWDPSLRIIPPRSISKRML